MYNLLKSQIWNKMNVKLFRILWKLRLLKKLKSSKHLKSKSSILVSIRTKSSSCHRMKIKTTQNRKLIPNLDLSPTLPRSPQSPKTFLSHKKTLKRRFWTLKMKTLSRFLMPKCRCRNSVSLGGSVRSRTIEMMWMSLRGWMLDRSFKRTTHFSTCRRPQTTILWASKLPRKLRRMS